MRQKNYKFLLAETSEIEKFEASISGNYAYMNNNILLRNYCAEILLTKLTLT